MPTAVKQLYIKITDCIISYSINTTSYLIVRWNDLTKGEKTGLRFTNLFIGSTYTYPWFCSLGH